MKSHSFLLFWCRCFRKAFRPWRIIAQSYHDYLCLGKAAFLSHELSGMVHWPHGGCSSIFSIFTPSCHGLAKWPPAVPTVNGPSRNKFPFPNSPQQSPSNESHWFTLFHVSCLWPCPIMKAKDMKQVGQPELHLDFFLYFPAMSCPLFINKQPQLKVF